LVMDALNETPDRKRWRNELAGMIQEVFRRPHLVLVISVRTDYLEQTLPLLPDGTDIPWVKWEHPGFSGVVSTFLCEIIPGHFLQERQILPDCSQRV